MWWSRRAALVAALAVAGCGFTPAYGPGGPAEGLRGQIAVAAPDDEAGYVLVRALEERLGRGSGPYALSFDIALDEQAVRVTPQEVTLRYQFAGEVRYRLVDAAGGEVLRDGRVESFTSYSAASTTVAARAAAHDAEERLMVLLADAIVGELLATAEEWRR